MRIKGNNAQFETCPEFTGKAVCVDVTPLRTQPSPYGEREVFKLVFEVDRQRADGTPYCVWSRNFTPSLNEKANFRKFLRSWFGRDLMQSELADFDTETLLGKPAHLVVVHEHKDGQVYARIAACTPEKATTPLKPSGTFTRRKDRDEAPGARGAEGGGATGAGDEGYRRTEQERGASSVEREVEHGAVKVHVGKYAGIELRDLNPEAVQALAEKWLPTARANPKPTADDRRLIAALEWWKAEQEKEADNVPY